MRRFFSQLSRRSQRRTEAAKRLQLEPLENRRLLATVTVSSALDIVDVPNWATIDDLPGPDNVVSLREAILATENTLGADEIVFDSAGVFSQPRTIALNQGVLTITRDLAIHGSANAAVALSMSSRRPGVTTQFPIWSRCETFLKETGARRH